MTTAFSTPAARSRSRQWSSKGLPATSTSGLGRVAVSGRTVSPPLYESIELLGRERTLDRLAAARALTERPSAG